MAPDPSPISWDSVRTIVFDLDGTLYRQDTLRKAMLPRLLRHGMTHPAQVLGDIRILTAYRRALEHLRGQGGGVDVQAEQLQLTAGYSNCTSERVRSCIDKLFVREPLKILKAHVYPEVPELLRGVRSKGIRLGIVSDYPAADKLEAMGLSEYFEVMIAPDRQCPLKPHPAGLLKAMAALGGSARETVYIGDRMDTDGLAARRAGVPFVLISRNRQGSNIINSYSQLRQLLAV